MKAKEFKEVLVQHQNDCITKFVLPKNATIMRVYLKHREDPFLAVFDDTYDGSSAPDVSSLMNGMVAHFKVLGTLTDHAVFVPLCGTDPVDDRELVVKDVQIAPHDVELVEFLAKFGEKSYE